MTFARWKISSEPGRTSIEVNGEDVSSQVERAALLLEPRTPQVPALQLELSGGGTLEGVGIVKVLPDEVVDETGAQVAVQQFLEQLDPTELEQRLTSGTMSSGIGAAVVVALKQMALR